MIGKSFEVIPAKKHEEVLETKRIKRVCPLCGNQFSAREEVSKNTVQLNVVTHFIIINGNQKIK